MALGKRQTLFLASQIGLLCLSIMFVPPRSLASKSSQSALITEIRKSASSDRADFLIVSLRQQGAPAIAALVQMAKNEKEPLRSRLFAIRALGQFREDAKPAVPTLIALLKSNQKAVRLATLEALSEIRESAKAAVPLIIPLLNDRNEAVRAMAAEALGNIGRDAKAAVSGLIEALNDPSRMVRLKAIGAIGNIGIEAKGAIAPLTDMLAAPEQDVRLAAIGALGRFGTEAKRAVPLLAEALDDPESLIRTATATTLGGIGAEASSAVPQLIRALRHPDSRTRSFAATALGMIGNSAKDAVPTLTDVLKDPEKGVQIRAASALGGIGLEARSALPELVKLLRDENLNLRVSTAFAISQIAGALQDKATTLSASEINTVYTTLESTLPILQDPQAQFRSEIADTVRRSLSVLRNEKDSRLFERFFEWTQANPIFAGILLYLISMPSLWFTVLLIRPLWLLKINNGLQPYTDFEIPSPMGGVIRIPLRFVLFVGWFQT